MVVTWFLLLPLLVTSVSFLILILPSPITSLPFLVHVSTTSVIFVAYALFLTLIRLAPSAHLLFFCPLQTWLLQFDVRVLLSSSNAVKSPSKYPECFSSCCCCNSQVLQSWPYSQIAALRNALNTELFPSRVSSSSLLLHVILRSHHSPAFSIHSIIRIGHSSSTITWLQSRGHRLLTLVRRTSLVEQASSYSSCSLSIRSFIITQLFSTVILWSWTACWPFWWRFQFSS